MVKFTATEDRIVSVPSGVIDAEKKVLDELIKDPGYSYVNIVNNLGISKKQ